MRNKWNIFKQAFMETAFRNIPEDFANVLIAVGGVYLLAWLFSVPADQIVGWYALGLAATSKR